MSGGDFCGEPLPLPLPVIYTNEEYVALKAQHVRLMHKLTALEVKNTELEDKLLHVVEKTEGEKLLLSHEIDELAARLSFTSNNVILLENECARYKKDCILAVHLLQCQPSTYIAQKMAELPVRIQRLSESSQDNDNRTPRLVHMTSSTFPPTAAFFIAPEESESDTIVQPDDPAPNSKSRAEEFVESIKQNDLYSTCHLKQCPNCGASVVLLDKQMQCDMQKVINTQIVKLEASKSESQITQY